MNPPLLVALLVLAIGWFVYIHRPTFVWAHVNGCLELNFHLEYTGSRLVQATLCWVVLFGLVRQLTLLA